MLKKELDNEGEVTERVCVCVVAGDLQPAVLLH